MKKIEILKTENVKLGDGRRMPITKGEVVECPDDKIAEGLIKSGRARIAPPAKETPLVPDQAEKAAAPTGKKENN